MEEKILNEIERKYTNGFKEDFTFEECKVLCESNENFLADIYKYALKNMVKEVEQLTKQLKNSISKDVIEKTAKEYRQGGFEYYDVVEALEELLEEN